MQYNDGDKIPKFLQVSQWQISQSYNKYLPNPYKLGEVVKVAPIEEQKPNREYDDRFTRVEKLSIEKWRSLYCAIYRRDEDGKFTHRCVLEWKALEFLKKK